MSQVIEVPGIGPVEFPDGMTDAQIVAAIKANMPQEAAPTIQNQIAKQQISTMPGINQGTPEEQKRDRDVRVNAVMETAAAIPDMFLNAPANAINLGNAAVGTGASALGRPDLAPNLMEPPNYARRAMTAAGLINPQNAPQTEGEGYLAAGLRGMAAGAPGGLPGMAVGGLSTLAGHGASQLTDNPTLGTLAGIASQSGMRAGARYGSNQIALAEALKKQRMPSVDTLKEVRNAGYSIPPGQVRDVPWYKAIPNALLEKLGGKVATAQQASIRNEGVTDALSRKYIGAAKDAQLTKPALAQLREDAAGPYKEIAALSPRAAATLEKLKQARFEANDYYKAYNRTGEPANRIKAEEWRAKSDALESKLETFATNSGRPDLVPKLRESRVAIAKIHEVENTLNTATGQTSAREYAKALEAGKPLSGGALTAAKMATAYPKAVQENVGMPGVNQLTQLLGAGMGSGIGATLGGPAGAGLGGMAGIVGLPAAQSLARQLILSKPYQQGMVTPNYSAGAVSQGMAGMGTSPQVEALIAAMMAQQQR